MNSKQKKISSQRKWIPDGFHFLGPEESQNRRVLLQKFSEIFVRRGFSEVNLPSFDYTTSFRSFLESESENLLVSKDWEGNELSPGVDLTLQVVKGMASRSHWEENQNTFYFARKIRDHKKRNASRREILQVGAESFGASDNSQILNHIEILIELVNSVSTKIDYSFVFGHSQLFRSIISFLDWNEELTATLRQFLYTKNLPELLSLAARLGTPENNTKILKLFLKPIPFANFKSFQSELLTYLPGDSIPLFQSDLENIEKFELDWKKRGLPKNVIWDPSLVRDVSYYTGLVFQGYIPSDPEPIFAGGVYNELYFTFSGIEKDACGFALHLDPIEELANIKK
ncbi:ATP phosphoribosyltransferase regulatory subunit [Leptospira sp. 96542]|nr:ATP phosphoribosyltransferase regulatory subunit [Leptospira sp. 96542]